MYTSPFRKNFTQQSKPMPSPKKRAKSCQNFGRNSIDDFKFIIHFFSYTHAKWKMMQMKKMSKNTLLIVFENFKKQINELWTIYENFNNQIFVNI